MRLNFSYTYTRLIKKPSYLIIGALACLLLMASTIKIIYLTKTYGGGELKRRIVGARLLHTNKQPYHYNWCIDSNGIEQHFVANGDQPKNLNGLSVPPSVLYFLKPLSKLPYNYIRVIWNLLQVLAFFGTIILILKAFTLAFKQQLIVLAAALIFYISTTWHVNIERGQIYIFYAFIFALLNYWYVKNTLWSNIGFGILLATATWLRPFYGVIFINLIFCNKKVAIVTTLITGLILLGITFLHWPIWLQYFKAMQMYITYNATEGDAAKYAFKGIAEGLTNYDMTKADWAAGGITPLGYTLFNQYHLLIPTYIYYLLVVLITIGISFYFKNIKPYNFMLLGFLCYLIFELIMPAQRGSYNVIIWLMPILSLFATQKQSNLNIFLLLIGFAFIQGWPFYFPVLSSLGEIILIGVLLYNLKQGATLINKLPVKN